MTPTETPTPAAVALAIARAEIAEANRDAECWGGTGIDVDTADRIFAKIAAAGISLAGPDQVVVNADDASMASLALDHMSDNNTNFEDEWIGPYERISKTLRDYYAALGAGAAPEGEIQHG